MRRCLMVLGSVAVLGLASCGGADSVTKPAPTQITAPAAKARGVVAQQNQQLQQIEQQTSEADPTAP